MNLSQAKGVPGHFDFTRVESITVTTYVYPGCFEAWQRVLMVMYAGERHFFDERIGKKEVNRVYKALVNAVKRARKE